MVRCVLKTTLTVNVQLHVDYVKRISERGRERYRFEKKVDVVYQMHRQNDLGSGNESTGQFLQTVMLSLLKDRTTRSSNFRKKKVWKEGNCCILV